MWNKNMTGFIFLLLVFGIVGSAQAGSLIITGIIDGPLTGGVPKAVELYTTENIADLSLYGLGSATNGGGSDGKEFTFPPDSAAAGSYIYVASEDIGFSSFFGFHSDYQDSAVAVNGNDAIELFHNGSVIDVFGDISFVGLDYPWFYADGWAYRKNGTMDRANFLIDDWYFSGIDALDGEAFNSSAATPMPIGTYNPSPVPIPSSLFLLGSGMAGFIGSRLKRRKIWH